MDTFKEFAGRDLDDCIARAMEYYDAPRDNLEVEIIQDAKTGIFGIVGARKAKIRARRAHVRETVASLLANADDNAALKKREQPRKNQVPKNSRATDAPAAENAAREPENGRQPRQPAQKAAEKQQSRQAGEKPPPDAAEKPAQKKIEPRKAETGAAPGPEQPATAGNGDIAKESVRQRPSIAAAQANAARKPERQARMPEKRQDEMLDEMGMDELDGASWPDIPLEQLDAARVEARTLEIVGKLAAPLAGKAVDMEIDLSHGRPRVHIHWQGDAGILIGKDGQTLAAMQYLASLMLARAMGAALRVQIDIGDYRARQEEKLKEMALALAARARETGRPYSTRPLSSYHRRIVHMSLHEAEDVQTRSMGDGPLKKVLISPKRSCQR